MGLEAGTLALLSMGLSAAGTGANLYNQRRTAQRQEDQALRGLEDQQAKQRQIDERLNAEVGALERSTPEDEQQQALTDYLAMLRANRGGMQGESTPGVSRFGEDTALAEAAIKNYASKVADTLSRITATQEQRRNEGFGINRAAGDAAGIAREAAGEDFINRLRMSQIRPNEWLSAGSELVSGIGSGLATYAGTLSPKAPTSSPSLPRITPPSSSSFGGRYAPGRKYWR